MCGDVGGQMCGDVGAGVWYGGKVCVGRGELWGAGMQCVLYLAVLDPEPHNSILSSLSVFTSDLSPQSSAVLLDMHTQHSSRGTSPLQGSSPTYTTSQGKGFPHCPPPHKVKGSPTSTTSQGKGFPPPLPPPHKVKGPPHL